MADQQRPVAIVTGAGSGVGRASALQLATEGFTVVASGRTTSSLEQVVGQIRAASGTGLAVPCDISSEHDVERLFATVESQFGRLDVLFNNAGASLAPTPIEDVALSQWEQVVATNLTGTFLCTRAAFKLMKRQAPSGGRIINNGSISAHTPRPLSAAYTSTKHAITGLTRSCSLDGRAYRIVCGQIDIGNVNSPMTAAIGRGALQADGSTLPEPTIDAEIVARAVVYMATLPLDANVLFMTVMANGMPFVGRG